LFAKFANTLCGDGDPILLPPGCGHVDGEAELAVVIGVTARALSKERALDAVAGWMRDELDVSDLAIAQRLNGDILQKSRTSHLIFHVPELISYVSHVVTLEPGDLILTGTPAGVGVFRQPKVALAAGDVVEVEVEGIGILRNPVRLLAAADEHPDPAAWSPLASDGG
jgi:acylpyruvate hydrolase